MTSWHGDICARFDTWESPRREASLVAPHSALPTL
jgi:hypothetical protein